MWLCTWLNAIVTELYFLRSSGLVNMLHPTITKIEYILKEIGNRLWYLINTLTIFKHSETITDKHFLLCLNSQLIFLIDPINLLSIQQVCFTWTWLNLLKIFPLKNGENIRLLFMWWKGVKLYVMLILKKNIEVAAFKTILNLH